MRRIFIMLFLLIAATASLCAQKLIVESFKLATSDLTAQTQPRKDLNDRNCALIKVGLGLNGVLFEGSIMGNVENKTGEYWVYMPQGNRQLKVKHPNYAPVIVTFADYDVEKLESNRTYELIVSYLQNVNSNQTTSQPLTANTISIPVKDGISIDMVRVEAGTFTMGATREMKKPRKDEKPVHQVTLTNDYYIGKYEVTQALWQAVMGYNPSNFKGDDLPVEKVNWNDCQEFISKLNNITGKKFRLPTEAEWEYAARGGNKCRGYQYSGSNNISDVAWYTDNSENKTHPVGLKHPNELGIYDMSGNVWEWCQDWRDKYNKFSQTNPLGAIGGARVSRGGCWFFSADYCRSSFRGGDNPNNRLMDLGFRLALSSNNF